MNLVDAIYSVICLILNSVFDHNHIKLIVIFSKCLWCPCGTKVLQGSLTINMYKLWLSFNSCKIRNEYTMGGESFFKEKASTKHFLLNLTWYAKHITNIWQPWSKCPYLYSCGDVLLSNNCWSTYGIIYILGKSISFHWIYLHLSC